MEILTDEKRSELRKLAAPVVEWLNENCHPHVKVLVTPESFTLMEDQFHILVEEFIKD